MQPATGNIGAMAVYHRVLAFLPVTIYQLLWDIIMHEQLLPPQMRQPAVAKQGRHTYETSIAPVVEEIVKLGVVTAPHYPHFTAADIMLAHTISWADIY